MLRASFWRYKENYVTWNAPEKFREFWEIAFRKPSTRPTLGVSYMKEVDNVEIVSPFYLLALTSTIRFGPLSHHWLANTTLWDTKETTAGLKVVGFSLNSINNLSNRSKFCTDNTIIDCNIAG